MSAPDSWRLRNGLVSGPGSLPPGFGLSSTIPSGSTVRPRAPERSPFGSARRACYWRWCQRIFCRSGAVSVDNSTPHRNETLGAVVKELLQGIVITLRCRPFQQICIATFLHLQRLQHRRGIRLVHHRVLHESG